MLHRNVQAEGGQWGDPLMPLLLSLAIHDPLEEASRELRPEAHLFACLDDVYFSSDVPDGTRTAYNSLGEKLFTQAVHTGRTRVWNRASVCLMGMEVKVLDTSGFESVRGRGLQQATEGKAPVVGCGSPTCRQRGRDSSNAPAQDATTSSRRCHHRNQQTG